MFCEIEKSLAAAADKKKAHVLSGFFKTGPGQYGEGDVFIGISVPCLREQVRRYRFPKRKDILRLLRSRIHEYRMLALLFLVEIFRTADESGRKDIYELYLANTRYINNWDLVDLSAPQIIGEYLGSRPREILAEMAVSSSLWRRRIAVVATLTFIRNNQFSDTFKIVKILLQDKHDLIRKACGWMLREIGKRDLPAEEGFLGKYYKTMPRTMLRYAIERFPESRRQDYLKSRV